MSGPKKDPKALFAALRAGDRGALARALTLVESTDPVDGTIAQELLEYCIPVSGASLRIGITGIPGVGKSSLIDPLGMDLVQKGHRVAVLAVDPSSSRSGGSILGDKTRMQQLGASPWAYIRPSPTGGTLGGVARRTQTSMLVCEAAGFDRILVETVGVGQNELAVDSMTDITVLLAVGGTGDELQGIKRGIMETADIIVITKADGDRKVLAEQARQDLRAAIGMMPPRPSGRRPEVIQVSALTGAGMEELGKLLESTAELDEKSGFRAARRKEQRRLWLRAALEETFLMELRNDPQLDRARQAIEGQVEEGLLGPPQAAKQLLRLFRTGGEPLP